MLTSPDGGGRFEALLRGPGDEYVIGRGDDGAVQVGSDGAATRHCRLYVHAGVLYVENLGEAETKLNGKLVAGPMRVSDGVELRVGSTSFRVAVRADPSAPGGAGEGGAVAPAARSEDDLIEWAAAELQDEFEVQTQRMGTDALRGMIERGIERARSYGLETDEQVLHFVRCMVMLDDEIDGRSPATADVWLTLTHAKRTAEERINRAVKIATRLASERSGKALSNDAMLAMGGESEVESAQSSAGAVSDVGRTAGVSGTHETRATPPPASAAGGVPESFPEIEGFTIREEIGAGGMGRVFLCYDHQLDKDVAIKVLRSVEPEAQEQLQQEARAAARLEHPNIVQVLRFERLGRGGYYVMHFVRGMDAAKLVKTFEAAQAHQLTGGEVLASAGVDVNRSPAELREIVNPEKNAYYRLIACWIAGVADGLERAHAEGVLHRDIKPSNLLLSSDGRMMITDFGLAARPAHRQGAGRARVGTPRYLSPERVADWASFSDEVRPGDARADVWSLGAVLYKFLTYRPAFRGAVAEVLREIVTEGPERPTSLVWSVPEPLEAICMKAMARAPDHRFSRASEFAESLRGWVRTDLGVEKKGWIPFLS